MHSPCAYGHRRRFSLVVMSRSRLVMERVTFVRAAMPPRYIVDHPRQLSLAIRPWLGTVSTGASWESKKTPRDALAPPLSSHRVSLYLAKTQIPRQRRF